MKKLHNWILHIVLLATFVPSISTAQCLIERCNGTKYKELRVTKLDLKLAHSEVISLLNRVAPGLGSASVEEAILIKNSTDPSSNFTIFKKNPGDDSDDTIPKYKVAGLVFLPIWSDRGRLINKPNTKIFHTIGIRVVVALWQKDSTCNANNPDLLHIAGFEKVDRLVPPNSLPPAQLRQFTISLSLDPENPIAYPERDLINKVKEFDFVFLEYNRYEELATSAAFYKDGEGRNTRTPPHEGIAIERSLISYDIKSSKSTGLSPSTNECYSEQTVGGSERLYFRTLYFSPDPAVNSLGTTPGRPAIAFEDAKRCPPYWINDSDNRCNFQEHLAEVVCRTMPKGGVEVNDRIKLIPAPQCLVMNIGRSLPTGNKDNLITQGGNFFEIGLEQKIWKQFISLETLIGRYQFEPDTSLVKAWGLKMLLKGSLPISKFLSSNNNLLNRSFLYLEGGAGFYFNLPVPANFGPIGGAGLSIPIEFNNKHFFNLALGAQYQQLTRTIDANNPTRLVTGKIGIKRCFW